MAFKKNTSKTLLKDLAFIGSDEYLRKLQLYLRKIQILQDKMEYHIGQLEQSYINNQSWLLAAAQNWANNSKKQRSLKEQENFAISLNAQNQLATATKRLHRQKDTKQIELIMKESYRLIDEMRREITGEPTTFRVAVNVGGEKTGRIHEVALPLDEILSSANASAVFGASSIRSSLGLRLHASASKRSEWVKKYHIADITEDYNYFVNNYTMGNLNIGRRYEYFNQVNTIARAQLKNLQNTTLDGQMSLFGDISAEQERLRHFEGLGDSQLEMMRKNITRDNLSFVKGTDYIRATRTGYQYESLKSFLGGDPSLANLDSLFRTLSSIKDTISIVQDPVHLQEQLVQALQMQGQEEQLTFFIEETIQEQIPEQVIKPSLDEIFPTQSFFNI